MCLILLAHRAHAEYPLVLAANRDEFYARSAAPADFWPDAPDVLAGRDLRGGGTWLGVTRGGRWAAVTNYRDPSDVSPSAPSRGALVADFLTGEAAPEEYTATIRESMDAYNGFNLVFGDASSAWWISNRAPEQAGALAPGIHGVSNALLNTPWPKVVRGRREMESLLAADARPVPERLLDALLDRTMAAEHELPDTGVDPALERALSASFIETPEYGTRSSTAVLIHHSGRVELVERTYTPGSTGWTAVRHELHPGD